MLRSLFRESLYFDLSTEGSCVPYHVSLCLWLDMALTSGSESDVVYAEAPLTVAQLYRAALS